MDAITRDFYEERRRKWRRSAFIWGFVVAGVLALIIAAIARGGAGWPSGPHIAHITVEGIIYDDPDRYNMLLDLRDSEDVKAVFVEIASPGGTTVGSEALFEQLREIGETRPIVAVMGEVAASGGYIAALGADHIIARGNTLTGSIGVIMEYPDVSALLGRVGVEFRTVRSSDLKGEPAPYRPPSDESVAVQQALIDDSYAWFRSLVAERRGLEGSALELASDGRVFTGRQALEAGLVDALGGPEQGLDWLDEQNGDFKDMPLKRWELAPPETGIWAAFSSLSGFWKARGSAALMEPGPRLLSVAR